MAWTYEIQWLSTRSPFLAHRVLIFFFLVSPVSQINKIEQALAIAKPISGFVAADSWGSFKALAQSDYFYSPSIWRNEAPVQGLVAVLVALIVAGARQTGPDERPGFWGAWLLIAISGVLLLAALRRGERALLAYAALVPFALFLLLLLMELTGLME